MKYTLCHLTTMYDGRTAKILSAELLWKEREGLLPNFNNT